jgi:hypothetical protein
MSEALSSTLAAAALAVGYHQATAASAAPPSQATQAPAQPPGNINAPFFVSPKISFDPVTSIVFVTFRNFETGKVREQIPPVEVLERYREASVTGHPDPRLPPLKPDQRKAEPAPTPAADKSAASQPAPTSAAPTPAPQTTNTIA